MKTTLKISGLHCNSCKWLIEDVCRDIKGVTFCSVNLEGGKAEIEHDDTLDPEVIKKEIEGLGKYKIEEITKV